MDRRSSSPFTAVVGLFYGGSHISLCSYMLLSFKFSMLMTFLFEGLDLMSASIEIRVTVTPGSEHKNQGILFSSSQFYRFSFPSIGFHPSLRILIPRWEYHSTTPPRILFVFFPIGRSTGREKNNYINVSSLSISISTCVLRLRYSFLIHVLFYLSRMRPLIGLFTF